MTTLNLKSSSRARALLSGLALVCGLALAAPAANGQSGETGKALKVHMNSGEPHYFMLSSEPVITFEGDQCVIKSSEFSTKYDIADIYYAELVDHTTSIDDELANALTVDLSDPNAVVIRGMGAGSTVMLYNTSGLMMRQTSADELGTATLSLSDLAAAVYIVTSKETTFKIYKK